MDFEISNALKNQFFCLRFGHEDAITGIDSLAKDRCVTSGGRDRTVRLWKIPEESQLVFRAHK